MIKYKLKVRNLTGIIKLFVSMYKKILIFKKLVYYDMILII